MVCAVSRRSDARHKNPVQHAWSRLALSAALPCIVSGELDGPAGYIDDQFLATQEVEVVCRRRKKRRRSGRNRSMPRTPPFRVLETTATASSLRHTCHAGAISALPEWGKFNIVAFAAIVILHHRTRRDETTGSMVMRSRALKEETPPRQIH